MNLLSWFLVRMLCPGLNTPREPDPGTLPSHALPFHIRAQLSSLDEFSGKGFKLPSGGSSSQQQVQALPGQHVSQHSQEPLWGLGVVRIHCLGTGQKVSEGH